MTNQPLHFRILIAVGLIGVSYVAGELYDYFDTLDGFFFHFVASFFLFWLSFVTLGMAIWLVLFPRFFK